MDIKELRKLNRNERSEEISDIIERMPIKFGRWVAGVIIFLMMLLFIFGWLIKYPDTITGQIFINAKNASVKLVANSSGKLWLTEVKPQQQVKEGDYIAYIQNSANIEDIKKIFELINNFNIKETFFVRKIELFPKKMSLGELNVKYFSFLNSLQKICNYQKNNNFQKKEENFLKFIVKQNEMLNYEYKTKRIKEEILNVSYKALQRDSSMRNAYTNLAVSEDEFEKTKMTWLNINENYVNLCKDITSTELQINDAKNKIEQNRIEKEDNENQLYLDLLSAYNDLLDNLKLWEQKYVFKAPFQGRVEYLKFWSNNQYIQTGEEAFTIVPLENKILGQVQLPTLGAGKIKNGCEVIIKLDNYPYMEYGSIKGKVKSISLTTKTVKTENQGSTEAYLVLVELPDNLATNYGSKLEFKYELKGTADIIANDRRLIERLFDNLRYRMQN